MAATCKTDLRAATQFEFEKLTRLIATIDAATALKKGEDDTSIKDVIAHRAHWIGLFLGWYADGQAGIPVFFPAQGYKWNDLKRYNRDLRQRQSGLDWAAATALLRTNYDLLMAFIDATSGAELYGGPMAGANNAWTPGRWAEAEGQAISAPPPRRCAQCSGRCRNVFPRPLRSVSRVPLRSVEV